MIKCIICGKPAKIMGGRQYCGYGCFSIDHKNDETFYDFLLKLKKEHPDVYEKIVRGR